MKSRASFHNIKYSSALANRAIYGGVYTSDIVAISFIAFMINLVLSGRDLQFIYLVIASVCIPFYIFLLVNNNLLPDKWYIFATRNMVGASKKLVSMRSREEKWDF